MVQTDAGIAGAGQGVLDRAIALDPEFAPAHTALGLYYSMLASLGNRPTREVIPLARAAVHEALRIDPSLSEPHALLGVWAGGYDSTTGTGRNSIGVWPWLANPSHATFAFGTGTITCCRSAGSRTRWTRWRRGSKGIRSISCTATIFADGLRNAGRFEEAEAELRRILELDGNFPMAVGTLGAALRAARQIGRHCTE